jgi:hypothetical protein
MSCKGLHCPGCGDGGGGILALVVLVLVIAAAIARPVAHAADAVLRVLVEALEITGIVLASVAGLGVLAGMVYGARGLYRWRARNRQAITRHTPVVLRGSEALTAAQQAVLSARRPAIEAPRKDITLTVIAEDGARARRDS